MTTPPAEMVTSVLRVVQRARERGDIARARVLLRRLAEHAPNDWQVWQALAEVAENDDERAVALGKLAALASPPGPRITRPLEAPKIARPQTTNHGPRTEDQPSLVLRPSSSVDVQRAAPVNDAGRWDAPRAAPVAPPPGWFRGHWLTYASLALLVLLLLAAAFLLRDRLPSRSAAQATPTPALATAAPAGDIAVPAATAPLPTLEPQSAVSPVAVTSAPALPTAVQATPATPAAGATSTPTSAVAPALAVGQVVDRGDWSFTVLRPEHLLALDGSIGSLAPQGRFVLALVGVSNRGPSPALLPLDALELVDGRGRRYPAQPAASSAYLSTYERGVRGDLSMEEPVPAGAGLVSIPVLFDVPPDATGLTLVVGGANAGWPVGR